jgi:drug/metabolite transporter (DMT)-like permease
VALILFPVAAISTPLYFQISDIVYLVVLGSIITALDFAIYYSALASYNPTTLGIASSLEAVYGISLALLVMQAMPSMREIIGGMIIISAVAYNEWQKKRGDQDK